MPCNMKVYTSKEFFFRMQYLGYERKKFVDFNFKISRLLKWKKIVQVNHVGLCFALMYFKVNKN